MRMAFAVSVEVIERAILALTAILLFLLFAPRPNHLESKVTFPAVHHYLETNEQNSSEFSAKKR